MPFFLSFVKENTSVHLWKLEEDCATLAALLQDDEQASKINKQYQSPFRQREAFAEQILLKQVLGKAVRLRHRDNGAPFLENSVQHISISHTKQWIAIALNHKHGIGIDMEKCSERVHHVASRFLQRKEQKDLAAGNPQEVLTKETILWSAKESLFKMSGCGTANDMTRFCLFPFPLSDEGEIQARIFSHGHGYTFSVFYKRIGDSVLTLCEFRPVQSS